MSNSEERPDPLTELNSLLDNPPSDLDPYLGREQIADLIKGIELWAFLQNIDTGRYLNNLLSVVDWWKSVADACLDPRVRFRPFSLYEHDKEFPEDKVTELLSNILELYPIAYKAKYYVDAIGSDPTGLELIKRLQELKKFVLTLANKSWPGQDFSRLSGLI